VSETDESIGPLSLEAEIRATCQAFKEAGCWREIAAHEPSTANRDDRALYAAEAERQLTALLARVRADAEEDV
jgi:hypothetical protein